MARTRSNIQPCEYCRIELPKEQMYHHPIYSYMCCSCYKNYLDIKNTNYTKPQHKRKTHEELMAIKEKYSKINIDEEINKWLLKENTNDIKLR